LERLLFNNWKTEEKKGRRLGGSKTLRLSRIPANRVREEKRRPLYGIGYVVRDGKQGLDGDRQKPKDRP